MNFMRDSDAKSHRREPYIVVLSLYVHLIEANHEKHGKLFNITKGDGQGFKLVK